MNTTTRNILLVTLVIGIGVGMYILYDKDKKGAFRKGITAENKKKKAVITRA